MSSNVATKTLPRTGSCRLCGLHERGLLDLCDGSVGEVTVLECISFSIFDFELLHELLLFAQVFQDDCFSIECR